MTVHVGIDLGTTNSVICSYDGQTVTLHRNHQDQSPTTASAIYVDRRGQRYYGRRAYDMASHSPDSAASLFKRLMGSGTKIKLPAVNLELTPEECSAEILRVLAGWLPEELRLGERGTVITVPAAFNQMQRDATMAAAEMAGIGRVALMQEPVAAVMAVTRAQPRDATFLVFDLGGGTLDVAVAQATEGRISILAHGGIAMCGGRDFDRAIVDQIVRPWLLANFDLPEGFSADPAYRRLPRLAAWAAERAKIELSAASRAAITLPEHEIRLTDRRGRDLYLDVMLERETLDRLVRPRLEAAIGAARTAVEKSGLTPHDLEAVVFVGGPTHDPSLRRFVADGLGIAPSTIVDPMTAVAEGAALFAESVDWESETRGRKPARGALSLAKQADGAPFELAFAYAARTPEPRARLVVRLTGSAPAGATFDLSGLATGWTSGRRTLADGIAVELPLPAIGPHVFVVAVYDGAGVRQTLPQDRVTITRTAATIDAIPASSSIAVEVLERLGGGATLFHLVRDGDPLPKRGQAVFRATQSIRAGSSDSIALKLWEGEIPQPVTDNRFIGVLSVSGQDFRHGMIPAGAELICSYTVLDSGQIRLNLAIPSIGAEFGEGRSFYSRQAGAIDYATAARQAITEAESLRSRLDALADTVADPDLDAVLERLEAVKRLDPTESDPELVKGALDTVLECRRLAAAIRRRHLTQTRRLELARTRRTYEVARQYGTREEMDGFDTLAQTCWQAAERPDSAFETYHEELRHRGFSILWRQEWFVEDRFKWLAREPFRFADQRRHGELVAEGEAALAAGDRLSLRRAVIALDRERIDLRDDDGMQHAANIVAG